jgi:uncharacterized protein (TIGR02452 family)
MKEHNKYYWENKKQRTEIAQKHTDLMANQYSHAIHYCVENTKIYNGPIDNKGGQPTYDNVTMEVVRADTVSALLDHIHRDGRTALLNFASYKHPGGGFMVGSRAQEESLCHESFLYNVLKEFDDTYYDRNRQDLNRGLYRDRAIYSPDILFIRGAKAKKCDVITCAAPNFSVAERFVSREKNNDVLRERIRFVLEIAKKENVDTFIVGAWGCGVFQQDPEVVAKYFEGECQNVFTDSKIHMVFAVIPPLPNQTNNLTPFVKMVDIWNF